MKVTLDNFLFFYVKYLESHPKSLNKTMDNFLLHLRSGSVRFRNYKLTTNIKKLKYNDSMYHAEDFLMTVL